jgi:hypothetical protein
MNEAARKTEQIPDSWAKIGHIFATHDGDQEGGCQERPNLDWALIKIENKSLYFPNTVLA